MAEKLLKATSSPTTSTLKEDESLYMVATSQKVLIEFSNYYAGMYVEELL